MLILSRKIQQAIVIGGGVRTQPQVTLTVLEIRKGKVKLGFEADPSISIHRSEVRDRITLAVWETVVCPCPNFGNSQVGNFPEPEI